jgi:hypothetical protein
MLTVSCEQRTALEFVHSEQLAVPADWRRRPSRFQHQIPCARAFDKLRFAYRAWAYLVEPVLRRQGAGDPISQGLRARAKPQANATVGMACLPMLFMRVSMPPHRRALRLSGWTYYLPARHMSTATSIDRATAAK